MFFSSVSGRKAVAWPQILATVLILSAAFALAWQTLNAWRLVQTPITTPAASLPKDAQSLDLSAISRVFGSHHSTSTTTPMTALNLTLMGSFVHPDPSKSSVILAQASGAPKRYLAHAQLDASTRIHAIYPERVEIELNGRIEQLRFRPANSHAATTSTAIDTAELQQQQMQALREQMEAALEEANLPTDPTAERN